jgi:hypothetical protein
MKPLDVTSMLKQKKNPIGNMLDKKLGKPAIVL